MKPRVQHPKVQEVLKSKREGWWWFFRYYADELHGDGDFVTARKRHWIAPSRGDGKILKKEAEVERDKFLAKLNAPTAIQAEQQLAESGVALFGAVAQMYEEGYLGRQNQIAKPTRAKETFYLKEYLVPRWGKMRLIEIKPKAVEDWLHTTFNSWWTMHGVRAIMSRIFYYAEGHGLWEEGKRSPASKAKLGKKRHTYERRILTFDETARVLAHLEEPNRLIIETCIATGARISEVLGLKWKHVNFDAATIKIEQRVWQQDVGRPKSEDSRRVLGIGNLTGRFQRKFADDKGQPDGWVFYQRRDPSRPMWDSGPRQALHAAAVLEECDFPGLGPHSFRRANITWRQEVGGSAIEASKIAGHSDLEMTGEYTFVAPERQNELTRRIQERLAMVGTEVASTTTKPAPDGSTTPEVPPSIATLQPATDSIQ